MRESFREEEDVGLAATGAEVQGRVANGQRVLMLQWVTRMCGWASKSQSVLCRVAKRFTGLAPSAASVLKLCGQRLIEGEVREDLSVSRIEPR